MALSKPTKILSHPTMTPSMFRKGTGRMAIVDIANTIANAEGWNVSGSLAQRNNNPGNLVYIGPSMLGESATPGAGGFARFTDPNSGFMALENQISLDASRGLTVQQFINKYDNVPSEQQNYLNIFQTQLGASPSDSLTSLISGDGVVNAATPDTTDTTTNVSDILSSISNIDPGTLGIAVIVGLGLLLASKM
jgi:hypothetical protein